MPFDYESWLIDAAEPVLRRAVEVGALALTDWERALYCLWVADYSMRNAGDLGSAYDLASDFKTAGLAAARTTDLRAMTSLFALDDAEFERRYAGSFDDVCRELLAKQSLP
ncbi:MAG: hypothetical protein K8T90_07690 [Planctomycetes bacterium]|nr:hypothetical protein [Planctomycetota bacterium]